LDRLHCFDCLESTNTLAKKMAAEGAPEGTALIAQRQTGGRGRMGRSFYSPAGMGIYMSMILRPGCLPGQLMHLTCAVGVAMCDAVEKTAGFRPGIKWINDLVFEKRKIGGILTELSVNGKNGLVDYAVIGVGINCCQAESDFLPELQKIATSLAMASNKAIDPDAVAGEMLYELYRMNRLLLSDKKDIMKQYRNDCVTLGQQVAVHRQDSVTYGYALDIDDEGALSIEHPDGTYENVNSGEVSVRGMYGYI